MRRFTWLLFAAAALVSISFFFFLAPELSAKNRPQQKPNHGRPHHYPPRPIGPEPDWDTDWDGSSRGTREGHHDKKPHPPKPDPPKPHGPKPVGARPIPPKLTKKLSCGLIPLFQSPLCLIEGNRSRIYGVDRINGRIGIHAFFKTTGGDPGLAAAGVIDPVRHTDNIYVGFLPLDRLVAVASLSGVAVIEPSFRLQPHLNDSVHDLKADVVRNSTKLGYDGTGTVVGIVDSGIDLTHPAFLDGMGALKVKWLKDQKQAGDPVFINEYDIKNSGVTDEDGHGTHVASTAVGSGAYPGVAPGADLFFVKTTFNNTDVTQGVRDILNAPSRGVKPAVVNLSLGTFSLGHDGTSIFETDLEDVCVGNQTVVVSAGNDGDEQFHTSSRAPGIGDAPVTFDYSLPQYFSDSYALPQYVALWYDDPQLYDIQVFSPWGEMYTFDDIASDWQYEWFIDGAGFYTYVEVNWFPGAQAPAQGIGIYFGLFDNNGIPLNVPSSGTWRIAVVPHEGTTGGAFDVWTGPTGGMHPYWAGSFPNNDITGTLGVPATARKVVAVGSYVTKNTWVSSCGVYGPGLEPLQSLSPFSGQGPTRPQQGKPGRTKPEVSAPGQMIAAAYSHQWAALPTPADCMSVLSGSSEYVVLGGTSMAAPHVTGALALMFQANNLLSGEQAVSILENTCRRDTDMTGSNDFPSQDDMWGYGKVNALHAVLAVAPAKWSKIAYPGTAFSAPTARDVEVSPNFATDHTVFVLYDSGGPLEPMGDQRGELWKLRYDSMTWTRLGAFYFPNDMLTDIELSPSYDDNAFPSLASRRTLFVAGIGNLSDPSPQGRVWVSTDGGASFSHSESGMEEDLIFPGNIARPTDMKAAPLLNPTDPITLFVGFYGHQRLHRSDDSGSSWTPMGTLPSTGNPGDVYMRPLMVSPNFALDGILFAQNHTSAFFMKSTNGGGSFSRADAGLPTGFSYHPEPSVFDMGAAWVASGACRFFLGGGAMGGCIANLCTLDRNIVAWGDPTGSPPWNLASLPDDRPGQDDSAQNLFTSALAVSPAFGKDHVLFSGTYIDFMTTTGSDYYSRGVFKSFDGGNTWTESNSGFGVNPPTITKLSISRNFPNDGVIFAGATDGLWVDPVEDVPSEKTGPRKTLPMHDYVAIRAIVPSTDPWDPAQGPLRVGYRLENGIEGVNKVWVRVKDGSGKIVSEMPEIPLRTGPHTLSWDGMTGEGERVGTGAYVIGIYATKPAFLRGYAAVTVNVVKGASALNREPDPGCERTPTPAVTATPLPVTATMTPTPNWTGPALGKVWAGPNSVETGQQVVFHTDLSRPARLTLWVLDSSGRVVEKTLYGGDTGGNRKIWMARSQGGKRLAKGLYIYIIEAFDGVNRETRTGKLVVR